MDTWLTFRLRGRCQRARRTDPSGIGDRIWMEQTGVVPIAAICDAVKTTLRVGNESKRIDLPNTVGEQRCCQFLRSGSFRSRPRL
jgi:hypothetical protein